MQGHLANVFLMSANMVGWLAFVKCLASISGFILPPTHPSVQCRSVFLALGFVPLMLHCLPPKYSLEIAFQFVWQPDGRLVGRVLPVTKLGSVVQSPCLGAEPLVTTHPIGARSAQPRFVLACFL